MSKGKNLTTEQLRGICEGTLSNLTERLVAGTYSCSPATVSKVRRRLEVADITSVSQIANMSDQELAELYYGAGRAVSTHADITVIRTNRRLEKQSAKPVLKPDYKLYVELYLDKKIKLQVLFGMYKEQASESGCKTICRSTFYDSMHNRISSALGPDVYMPQQHSYGDEVAIDYCGDVFGITDSDGSVANYAVCVLAWAASNLVYAEFIPGQTTAATCEVIAHALQRWQCAPRILSCDNAKSMVIKHGLGREPIFNVSFSHYMSLLGITVMANNPRKPSEKSYVELSVRLVQDRVLKRMQLAQSVFYLNQANVMLMDLVDREINAVGFRHNGTGTPRKELFEQNEKPAASKLKEFIPEFIEYLPYLKVDRTYAVTIGKHKYSVPWRYAGEVVQAELSTTNVKLFLDHKLIAEHQRDDSPGCSIKDEHMKPEHLAVQKKRNEFADAASIIAAARLESSILGDFCQRFFTFNDMNRANGLIHMIRMYKSVKEDRKTLDEAVKRLMHHTPSEWDSYTFDKELASVRSEIKSGSLKALETDNQPQGNNASSSLCLHGREEFVGVSDEVSASNKNQR